MSEAIIKATLFKNEYKEEGDKKPHYQNKTICYPDDVLQEDIVLKKGQAYSIALWKGDNGSLSVKIQEAYKKKVIDKHQAENKDEEDIPF